MILKAKHRCMMRWSWLVLVLILASPDQPGLAQADAWHTGQIGVRWALRVEELLPSTQDGLLAVVNSSSSSELLLAASMRGAIAIDVHRATQVWEHQRSGEERYTQASAPPLLQGGTLYLYNTAFDALSGRQLWRAATDPQASMTLANGVLYMVGSRGTWAVDPLTGTILWHSPADAGRGDSRSPPLLVDDTLVVHDSDGQVWGLDADSGQPRWRSSFPISESNYLTRSAHVIYVPETELGQVLALTPADGQVLWSYPETDAAGTYAAPKLMERAEPLADLETLYMVDVDGRIVALEACSGALLWATEPTFSDHPGPGGLRRIDRTLVVGDPDTPLTGLDIDAGKIRWRRDDVSGRMLAIVANDVLLVGHREGIVSLIEAETGQHLGDLGQAAANLSDADLASNLELWGWSYSGQETFPLASADAVAEGGDSFVYFARDDFLIAIGPAAPGEAVAMASTFLGRGDYRSAVRTLSLLKASDEQGYITHGGQAVATQALGTWVDDAERRMAEDSSDNLSYFPWPQDLILEVTRLGIRDIQARMKYFEARNLVEAFDSQPGASRTYRSVDDIREVRVLKERFGDTLWAEQLEPLLAARRKPAAPRMKLGGPAYLGWWYLPFVLPVGLLLLGVAVDRRRGNLYRAGVAAGLSAWAGLVYLFWVGGLVLTSEPRSELFTPLLGADVALIGGVPVAVWLLTRSRVYPWLVLGLGVIHRFALYYSLLTLLK
jgi:outer membrane protein assembly factor BamB